MRREVLAPPGQSVFRFVSASRDDRHLYLVRRTISGINHTVRAEAQSKGAATFSRPLMHDVAAAISGTHPNTATAPSAHAGRSQRRVSEKDGRGMARGRVEGRRLRSEPAPL